MKTIKGMTSEEQQAVEEILAPYMNDYSFYYYGSRVKGNFSNLSDLDILIEGDISPDKLSKLKWDYIDTIISELKDPNIKIYTYDYDHKSLHSLQKCNY